MDKQQHRKRLEDLMEVIRLVKGRDQYYLLERYISEKEKYKSRWNEEFKWK